MNRFAVVCLLAFMLLLCSATTANADEDADYAKVKCKQEDDYAKVESLKEAVDLCKQKLEAVGKSEYAALISEQKVRDAIRTALKSYEVLINKEKENSEEKKKHFEKVIKPVFLKIANKGSWPKGCHFFYFFILVEKNGVSYDGLGLRLSISTPQEKFQGFAIPIVDLFYGRFNE